MTPRREVLDGSARLGKTSAVQGRVGRCGRRGGRVRRGSPIMRRDRWYSFASALRRSAGLRSVAAMAAAAAIVVAACGTSSTPAAPGGTGGASRARRLLPRARRPRRRRLPPRRRPRVVRRGAAEGRHDGQHHHVGPGEVVLHGGVLPREPVRAAAVDQRARRGGAVHPGPRTGGASARTA